MKGAKEAAMIILGTKPKSGDSGRRTKGEAEEIMEDEEYEYSDEQLQMAGELKSAIADGSETDILDAIHGIMMSYED